MIGRSAAPWAAMLWLGAACGSVRAPAGSGASVNACPEHPCSAYSQSPAPTCMVDDGRCETDAPTSGVVLLVSLPSDSFFAPSLQFVVPLDRLADGPPDPNCVWPGCRHLPGFGNVSGGYSISKQVQSVRSGVGFFLGNEDSAGATQDTWLPVHTTYRLLKDAWSDDVVSLGLPVRPIEAALTVNTGTPNLGPYGSHPIEFEANLPPGTYERIVAPDPPYDAVFGPQVRSDVVVSPVRGTFESVVPGEELQVDAFDVTSKIPDTNGGFHVTLPTFDISRDDGLDGWTAFLRDQKTKRVISNVRSLSGKLAKGVQLVTNHATVAAPDALTNAELVVAPPSGEPCRQLPPPPDCAFPAGVFAPPGEFPAAEGFPRLPQPVTVSGSVTESGPEGGLIPIAADLVFEALAFTDETGTYNYPLFEFVGHATARPGPTGQSAYRVALPLGPYRVDVRPLDGSSATLVTRLDVDASRTTQDFTLDGRRVVQGSAMLADGRPLAGATVEAIPEQCPTPPALADAGAPGTLKIETTTWCLPRPQQTVTADNGSFRLPLDAGGYAVRARPADGTGLPWVTLSLPDGPSKVNVVVPAPHHESFRLVGADGSPIVHAIVQAFAVPGPGRPAGDAGQVAGAGQAVELGEAITDTDGNLDLYLALPQ